MFSHEETVNGVTFNKIDCNAYGNPRVVFHYLELSDNYEQAVRIAKKFGGQKYRAKWYGGGIVIQSYNLADTAHLVLAHRIGGVSHA